MEDPTNMHAKNMPHMDDVDTHVPRLPIRFRTRSNDSNDSDNTFPILWLSVLIPLMLLFGETSILIAAAVLLVAAVRLIIEGFREHPIWGILNVSGFYFPVLWLAFGLTHWKKVKSESIFASIAGACIYYLSKENGITF